MAEFKRSTKNRGLLYVKMKASHKQGKYDYSKSFFFLYHRYLKRIVWISVSFCFFTSYLLTNFQRSTTTTSSTKTNFVSRALFESNTTVSQQPILKTKSSSSISPGVGLRGLKIYIYNLPSKYNKDWLSNKRCSKHLFASEVAIHEALMGSDDVRTSDPHEADFFFVPVYVSCNFSTINGFPAIGHARPLLSSAVAYIASQMPFWNRTNGSDHIFVASHDYGACFHAMEHVAIADGIPLFLKNSIILQTFGVEYHHPCQDVENVVIPPYISPEGVKSTVGMMPPEGRRDIWAFFRGKMEVHPKNVSGRFYSKKVRTVIWRKFNGHNKFYLRRHKFGGYQIEIARSVFCLCPLGWAPWSPRLVESVVLGCVPVIIADGIRLPFPDIVRWSDISLTVAERDVGNLDSILDHVAATNLTTIQNNLWHPRNREAMMFNNRIVHGDATWQVLHSLAQEKMDSRSYRRTKMMLQLSVDS